MTISPTRSTVTGSILAAALLALAGSHVAAADWLQWGGPARNFTVPAAGLAASWPSTGPKRLWSRTLGQGHSAILAEGQRLYTMYRGAGGNPDREAIAALDAASGKTVWEHAFDSPAAGLNFEYGAGPHSTPLIVGSRLFAIGSRGQLFALDKASGKVLWAHDLIAGLKGQPFDRGYSPSPIAYKSTVIVATGGAGQSLVAFDQSSGVIVWKAGDYMVAPASPILATVDGQEQLIVFGGNEVVGADPASGTVLWTHPHKTDWGLNISTPIWMPGNLLFISSAYGSGSRLLHLSQSGGKTAVKEVWYTNRMRVHIGSVLRIGDQVIGSSGDFGPAFVTALDVKTGRTAWQDRQFSRAQLLHVGDRVLVLDEDGSLGLISISPTGLTVHGRATVLSHLSWTPPTLDGARLYLRDRQTILALDLS